MATNYIGDPFYEEEEFQTFQQPQHFNLNDYPYRGPVQSGYTNTGNIVGYPGEAGYDDNLSFERDFRNNRLSDTGVQMAYKTPRTIADQNRVLGMTFAEDEDPQGLAALFQNLNIDPSSWGTSLKNKASTGWNLAQQLPGMAMSAMSKIPGIGMAMGALRNIRKDNPYEKFQKQTFADMGYQGDPNKDPWGKNIRSLGIGQKGGYDVRDQWSDLANSTLGQNYGYAEAMADGVIDASELAAMKDLGLRGWQLNRLTGLSEAKAKADAYHDKINAAQALAIKQKEDRKNRGRRKPGDNTINWNPNITGTKSFHPGQGGNYQGGNYGAAQGTPGAWGPGAKKDGGRVGYADGGLATLFTRRG